MRRVIALVALLLSSAPAMADPADALWSLKAEPSPHLGLAFPGKYPKYYPLMSEAGIGVARIGVGWKWVEPQPGDYRFSSLDERIAGLDALGIEPFLTFESNAAWAVRHGDQVKNGTPKDSAQWAAMINAVVERYDMDGIDDGPVLSRPVRFYQVANEFLSDQNRSGGWADSDVALVDYINTAHDAVKTADPEAIFVLGGIASMNMDAALLALTDIDMLVQQIWKNGSKTVVRRDDPKMMRAFDVALERLETVLAGARYDWVDVHLYGPEDRDAARIALMKDLSGAPVLSSECGGPSLDYASYSGQEHYRSVLWRNLNVLADGAPFCTWFGLGEAIGSTYGNSRVPLYDHELNEKPGVHAFRLLARLGAGEGAVIRLAPALFEIETEAGPVQMALREEAITTLLARVSTTDPALCIRDAETQDPVSVTQITPNACPGASILLAGPGLQRIF